MGNKTCCQGGKKVEVIQVKPNQSKFGKAFVRKSNGGLAFILKTATIIPPNTHPVFNRQQLQNSGLWFVCSAMGGNLTFTGFVSAGFSGIRVAWGRAAVCPEAINSRQQANPNL
ncbi:MAG: hypothetical protein ACK4Q5_21395 [Saprospiraceae bacterium]